MQAKSGALKETLEELRSTLDSEEKTHDLEEIWKVYYPSQCSPERKNIMVFQRRMPRTILNATGLKVEQNKNGLTLEDFFGSD